MKIQEIKAAYQALDPDDEPMLQQFITYLWHRCAKRGADTCGADEKEAGAVRGRICPFRENACV